MFLLLSLIFFFSSVNEKDFHPSANRKTPKTIFILFLLLWKKISSVDGTGWKRLAIYDPRRTGKKKKRKRHSLRLFLSLFLTMFFSLNPKEKKKKKTISIIFLFFTDLLIQPDFPIHLQPPITCHLTVTLKFFTEQNLKMIENDIDFSQKYIFFC